MERLVRYRMQDLKNDREFRTNLFVELALYIRRNNLGINEAKMLEINEDIEEGTL